MGLKAFRVQNFMGFRDSGWIELRPITLLFGKNSAGKSALLKALRMLQQSLDTSPDEGPVILSSGIGVDLGTYRDVVHGHNERLRVAFGFRCEVDKDLLSYFKPPQEKLKFRLDRWSARRKLSSKEAWAELLQSRAHPGEMVSPDEAWASLEIAFEPSEESGRRLELRQLIVRAAWSRTEDSDDSLILFAEWEGLNYGWRLETDFLEDHRISYENNPWSGMEGFITDQDPFPILPGSFEPGILPTEDFDAVRSLLHAFRGSLRTFLSGFHYVAPLRTSPERFYYLPALARPVQPGDGTEILRRFLALEGGEQWKQRLKQVNEMLGRFSFKLEPRHPRETSRKEYGLLFELMLTETNRGGVTANIQDTGFGWSQMLPLVITCALAEPGTTVLMEQPELHLHPGAQAMLGDVFLQATEQNIRFLIETHSEHILLRLQRRIRKSQMVSNDLNVIYVTRRNGKSRCHRLRVDRDGDFLDPWPEGFFEERFSELFGQIDG